MNRFKPKTHTLIFLLGAGAALPIGAQQSNSSDEGGLEEIVVTAQRRAENLQEVPISVTAVTGEMLEERGIRDISQLEGVTPGFTFGRSGSDARPAMRGVRTENVGVNGDTTIGYFIDGVYQSRAQQAMASFLDLERVEIQRGPQGTLYGRNTFGGNISVVTNKPQFERTSFGASLNVGSFDRRRLEAIANLPASDVLAFRFAGLYDRGDGWVENDFNRPADLFDENLKYGRISARFRPNEAFEATLRLDYTSQGGNGGSAFGYKQAGTYLHTPSCQQLFNATPYIANVRPGNRDGVNDCTRTQGAGAGTGANAIGTATDLGVPIYRAGDGYTVDTDYRSFRDLTNKAAVLDVTYDFGAVTLKAITGYSDFDVERTSDSDMAASTIAVDYQLTAAQTFSQELQLLSNGEGSIQYVLGYYYFKDELEGIFINQQLPRLIRSPALSTPLALAQNGSGFYDRQAPETTSNAVYGQLTFKATDALSLTVGARYTKDDKSFKFANANAVLPLALSTAGAFVGQQQPDTRLITIATAGVPSSAFGTAGTSNCPATFVTGYNGGANALPPGPGFFCGGPNNNVLFGATYDDQEFSKTTWRAAVDYKLTDVNLLYASYSTGFRSGGFNSGQALAAVRTFLPEEVKAAEIGSKNRFLDNRLQLNVAAYINRYENLQEQRQIPAGATTISTIFNAAKAEAKGVEVELQWAATDALTLGGTLAWLDAKYTNFPDVALPFGTSILVADPSATSATIVNGVTIAPAGQRRLFAPGYNCGLVPGTGGTGQPAAAFGCDLSGKRVPYSPRYSGSVYAGYEWALAGGKLTPLVVATFSDEFFGQPNNAGLERQASFVKADVKLTYESDGNWTAQLYCDNCGDKQTVNRMVWGGGGALQISVAPPRTYGLRLGYRY